jgi:tripartite-type tricarboxylate transporter receptor subunit TctC
MHKSVRLIFILSSLLLAFAARAEKFHAAGVKVLTEPAMQDSLKKLGVEAMPMTPSEMDDLVKRETAANMELIKAAGIKQ